MAIQLPEQWEQIFEHLAVGVAIISPDDQTLLAVNPAFAQMHGYFVAELVGRPLAETFAPESRSQVPLHTLAAGERGHDAYESIHLRKDGSRFPVLIDVTTVKSGDGADLFGVAYVQDTSERRQMEEALPVSGDQMRAIFQSIADGVMVQSADGVILYANDAAARLCGYASAAALQAASLPDVLQRFAILDEAGRPLPRERLPAQRAFSGEAAPSALLRFRVHTSGEERWAIVQARPVMEQAGSIRFVVSAFQEITTLKRHEIEQQFLSEASSILASSLDYETTLRRVAELAVPELADWAAVEILDEAGNARQVAVAHAGSNTIAPAPSLRQRYPLVARGRTLGALSLAYVDSGRRYSPADLALAEELARRAALAVDHARLYRDLQDALQARDTFLSAVSHDLRTPLSTIKGMTQLILRQAQRGETLASAPVAERLTEVDRCADRMVAMIDELLDLVRMEAGRRLELDLQAMDLVELAREVVAEAQRTTRRHRIVVEANTPDVEGNWDRSRLERALTNLVSNAVKYSPDGGEIAMIVSVSADSAGGRVAEIVVRDHGLGIPAADLPQIFEPFHRGANVAGRILGVGVGLAGVKQIIEQHGGTIAVESVEGAGATFTLRLPVEPGTDEAAAE